MKKGLVAFLSVFMLAVLAACGGTEGDEIELSETSVKINQNETMEIEATVLPDEEDVDQTVTWESSDEDVVQVTQDGEIGGMSGGSATVTVTSDVYEDVSAELDVTVLPRVDYVAVGEPNLSMVLGADGSSSTHEIDWEVSPLNDQENTWALEDLTFESTDEDVVTIEDGVITAHEPGSAQIEFRAGNEFTYIEVSVSPYDAVYTVGGSLGEEEDTATETSGIVTAITRNDTFLIEDASGAMAVYTGGDDVEAEVGDKVNVVGTRSAFNGLQQITADSITVLNSDNDLPASVSVDGLDLEDEDTMMDYQSHLVDMSYMEITEIDIDEAEDDDDYNTMTITLNDRLETGSEIDIRYEDRIHDSSDHWDALEAYEVGDMVNVEGMPFGWFYGPQLILTDSDQITANENLAEAPEHTISDVAGADDDTEIDTVGVVHTATGSAFYLQDGTGSIKVDADPTFVNDGDVYHLQGTKDSEDGNNPIITDLTTATKLDEISAPGTVDLTGMDLGDDDVMEFYRTKSVAYSNLVVSESNDYGNALQLELFDPHTEEYIDLRYEMDTDNDALETFLADLEEEDVVNLDGVMVAWYYGPQFSITSADQISEGEWSQALIDAYLEMQLDLPEETTSDLSAPSTVDYPPYTDGEDEMDGRELDVDWESGDTDVIANDGTVTRPEAGEDDAEVTITVTLTDPDDSDFEHELEFTVVVPAEIDLPDDPTETASDLFISEYIEGSSGNNKAIEIYNGTGSDVDLTDYTVELYSNGSTDVTNDIDLSGTLAHNDVLVIYNSGSDLDNIVAEGDETSAVTYFNGDDAITLSKDDTAIDVIGEVGVEGPWTVGDGSTEDSTLVRNSSVTEPSDTFDASEWDDYEGNNDDYIGYHIMD